MTNEEAISILMERSEQGAPGQPTKCTFEADIFAVEAAMDLAIEALKAGQWIDIKDRQPEKSSTFVLALTAPGELSIGQNCVVADYIKPANEPVGAFVLPAGGDSKILSITHWMPLPEVPEAQEC